MSLGIPANGEPRRRWPSSTATALAIAALMIAAAGCGAGQQNKPGSAAWARAQKAIANRGRSKQDAQSATVPSAAPERFFEAEQMVEAIQRGARMGPGVGWFGPGRSRYTWDWLTRRQGMQDAKAISKEHFRGNPAWFERLDRNHDAQLAAEDLNWSDERPYMKQYLVASQIFERLDGQQDGRVSREEWLALYEKAAGGRSFAAPADLAEFLLSIETNDFFFGDRSPAEVIIRALTNGDFGSPHEGPDLNEPAPDFELQTQDGERTIRLSDWFGSKPIVLVFGNFSCGPFRLAYPMIHDLEQRYGQHAQFLAVYVREAHPKDGWRMESNARVGVDFAQPKTYSERKAAAQKCRAALKCSMPLVVDTVDDRVGNAYSGMPSRLYVIDRNGRVAYKSGRGPYGFKAREMEQSLLLTLIDHQTQAMADE